MRKVFFPEGKVGQKRRKAGEISPGRGKNRHMDMEVREIMAHVGKLQDFIWKKWNWGGLWAQSYKETLAVHCGLATTFLRNTVEKVQKSIRMKWRWLGTWDKLMVCLFPASFCRTSGALSCQVQKCEEGELTWNMVFLDEVAHLEAACP